MTKSKKTTSNNHSHHYKVLQIVTLARTSCHFCGNDNPAVLDFHHVDESTKSFNISGAWRRVGMQKMLDELAKCIVVCANCHRLLHAGELEYDPRV